MLAQMVRHASAIGLGIRRLHRHHAPVDASGNTAAIEIRDQCRAATLALRGYQRFPLLQSASCTIGRASVTVILDTEHRVQYRLLDQEVRTGYGLLLDLY
jgi:hypothetical protein